jgi:hypothetical protein
MRVCYTALSLGSTEPQGRPIAITPLCSKKELAAAAARQGTGDQAPVPSRLCYGMYAWYVCLSCGYLSLQYTNTLCISVCTDVVVIWFRRCDIFTRAAQGQMILEHESGARLVGL